jgi:putative membrane protein
VPASRRTRYAEERTLLAWWRTGIAASAVAIGVGGVVPHLTGLPHERFVVLAAGYGIAAIFFLIGGSFRSRRAQQTLDRDGNFEAIPTAMLVGVTAYLSALVALTVIALL